MLFVSKNEEGVPAWRLVLSGRKTVTRRLKPLNTGKKFAVQPGRGKKAVCHCRVISCVSTEDWIRNKPYGGKDQVEWFNTEANREGFISWEGLLNWFKEKKIDFLGTYRIEFELIR